MNRVKTKFCDFLIKLQGFYQFSRTDIKVNSRTIQIQHIDKVKNGIKNMCTVYE